MEFHLRDTRTQKSYPAEQGKCGTNWQPKGSLFVLFNFFPPLCALYNKENTAWRAGGLEAKLAEMKTGL